MISQLFFRVKKYQKVYIVLARKTKPCKKALTADVSFFIEISLTGNGTGHKPVIFFSR